MMDTVESDRRAFRRAAHARRNLLWTEAKEFAACRPMKRSRARGICALRVKVLAQRSFCHHRQAGVRRLCVSVRLRSVALHFQLRDRGSQPVFERFFNLMVIAVPVE